MRRSLWWSVLVTSFILALGTMMRTRALPALGDRAGTLLRETRIPWDRLSTPGTIPVAAGVALAALALGMLARGIEGRRRKATRMVRSGRKAVTVARRTGLSQDAVRMLRS